MEDDNKFLVTRRKDIDKIINDVDSVAIVTKSLRTYLPDSFINIQISGRKTYPSTNQKLLKSLPENVLTFDHDYVWYEFRLSGFINKLIFTLLLVKKGEPVNEIRRSFMSMIIKQALMTLEPLSQSLFSNATDFNIYDKGFIKVWRNDWKKFSKAVDYFLEKSNFLELHSIKKIYFYSCCHGLKCTSPDAVDLMVKKMEIDVNSEFINLIQIHFATSLYPKIDEALFINLKKIKDLTKLKFMIFPNCFFKNHGTLS